MTAAEFADLVDARRIGAGRWQARCPAHDDRHPSMTITQGHCGVLLRCWSQGCTAEAICTALGIRVADLFDNHGLTPAERAEAARLSQEREAERKAQHRAMAERNGQLLKLENLVNALGAKLARNPDDRELGRLFHRACDRLHEMETATNETRPAGNEPLERIA